MRRAIRGDAFDGDPTDTAPADPVVREPVDRVVFGVRGGRWRITGNLDVLAGRRVEAALCESKDRLFDDGDTDVTWVDALVDVAERSVAAVVSPERRDRYRSWLHVDTRGQVTTTDGWRIPNSLAELILW